jgi:histidine phosphotransferase ChpT
MMTPCTTRFPRRASSDVEFRPLQPLDLAALIASRICHDLISPIGAVSNGIEVLTEFDDPSMRNDAIALIQKSSESARVKLKLCRLAYGSMSSGGSEANIGEAREALEEYLHDSKTRLEWDAPPAIVARNVVKLCVNMGLAALDTIPRGGVLKLTAREAEDGLTLEASAGGIMVRAIDELSEIMTGTTAMPASHDGRRVQAFMTALIAREMGASVETSIAETGVSLRARVPKAA